MAKSFKDLLDLSKKRGPKTISVAVAQDKDVLLAVKAAREKGIINPILVISDGWNCPNKGNLIHLLAPFTSIPSFGTKTKRRITTENT